MRGLPRASCVVGCAAALACLAVGCGKKPTPVDVTGKVQFAIPRPKAPLLLSLHPQEDANKTSNPSAVIDDKDGSFKLEKCLPGRYKATIAVVPLQVGGGPSAAPGVVGAAPGGAGVAGVPTTYFDAQASPWEVIVPEGGKDGLVLTLSPR